MFLALHAARTIDVVGERTSAQLHTLQSYR